MGMLALCTQTSCSSDDDPVITVGGATVFQAEPVVFEGVAGEQEAEIKFQAGGAWTAMLSVTTNWLEIGPTSGQAGQATIKVRPLSDNKGATSRSINLLVLVDGDPQTYTVKISQEAVTTSDLKISGDVNDGLMTLTADNTGNSFTGVLEITSSKKWNITPKGETAQWLTFQKDKEPQNGKETTVKLTVSAAYNRFTAPDMSGSFLLQAEGEAQPIEIKVAANSICKVYDHESITEGETERVTYELTEMIRKGTFQMLCYVESNIKWEIRNLPAWLQFTGEQTPTNMNADGTINPKRVHLALLLNPDYLSATKQEGDITLVNVRGEVLKTLHITFNGTSADYLYHNLSFPATDPYGNSFSFEARAEYIDPNNRDDYWKKIELPFEIQTARDYTSLEDAPFHMLLCQAQSGFAVKEEVHWASLHMGDPKKNMENDGIYTKEIYLKANDRPDADDQNGITVQGQERGAFLFIVPRNITFNDLFEPESSTLKQEYQESCTYILQKQDHQATYTLEFEGLPNKSEIHIPAEGSSTTYNVVGMTTNQIGYTLKRLFKPAGSDIWEERTPTTAQTKSIYIDYNTINDDELQSITLNVGENTTATERRFRFYFHAFRGNGYEDAIIFQFDIIQPAK